MNDTYRHKKKNKIPPKTLDEVFETQAAHIFEMEDSEISCLLAKAELLCRWLRGALHLKSTPQGEK